MNTSTGGIRGFQNQQRPTHSPVPSAAANAVFFIRIFLPSPPSLLLRPIRKSESHNSHQPTIDTSEMQSLLPPNPLPIKLFSHICCASKTISPHMEWSGSPNFENDTRVGSGQFHSRPPFVMYSRPCPTKRCTHTFLSSNADCYHKTARQTADIFPYLFPLYSQQKMLFS